MLHADSPFNLCHSKVPGSGMVVLATSSGISRAPALESFFKDTFEDYDDSQAGWVADYPVVEGRVSLSHQVK